MDINRKLYEIIHQYGLDCEYPEYWERYEIIDIINDMFSNYTEEEIAIRCGGEHTKRLYNILNEANRKKVKYVIDDKICENSAYPMWNVISREEAEKRGVTRVVISSYVYETEVALELVGMGIEPVSIYDYLRKKGHFLKEPFFEVKQKNFTYIDIWILRNQYRICGEENKELFLQRLIFACLMIRDFLTADKYIHEYISLGYSYTDTYKDFQNTLQSFFADIKACMQHKKQKNIIINWIDALHYQDAKNMKPFSDNDGIYFDQAYTVIPYTGSVMNTLFSGKSEITEKRSHNRTFTEEDRLLSELSARGYEFKYFSYQGQYRYKYAENMLLSYPPMIPVHVPEGCYIGCSTWLQWEAIQELLNRETPICMIIHNLAETHLPFLYSDMQYLILGDIFMNEDKWSLHRDKRYQGGLNFMEKQILWYRDFYNPNAIQVYMTDHGPTMDKRNYEDDRCHVALKVQGLSNKKTGIESRIFSYMNFWKFLDYCIDEDEKKYEMLFEEYIFHESLDSYNKRVCQTMLRWIEEKHPMKSHIRRYLKFRAVRSKDDLYVKYARGPELYFRNGDFTKNLLKDEKYKDRIQFLKNMLGEEWLKEAAEDKSEVAEPIYEKIEKGEITIDW